MIQYLFVLQEILPKRDPSEITVDLEVQQRIDNMIADGVPLNEVYAKIQNRETSREQYLSNERRSLGL